MLAADRLGRCRREVSFHLELCLDISLAELPAICMPGWIPTDRQRRLCTPRDDLAGHFRLRLTALLGMVDRPAISLAPLG